MGEIRLISVRIYRQKWKGHFAFEEGNFPSRGISADGLADGYPGAESSFPAVGKANEVHCPSREVSRTRCGKKGTFRTRKAPVRFRQSMGMIRSIESNSPVPAVGKRPQNPV